LTDADTLFGFRLTPAGAPLLFDTRIGDYVPVECRRNNQPRHPTLYNAVSSST
jgi:hypothetical protein